MKDQLQLSFEGMFRDEDSVCVSGVASVALRFNSEMLALAREAKGYTQKEMAAFFGSNQSRFSKIESGELVPQEADLQNFVRVLGQPRDFFFQRESAASASVSFYRKAAGLPLKMLRQCNAQMNVQRLQIEKIVGNARLAKRSLPCISPDDVGGAKQVARRLREEWGLPRGPIRNLTKLVEEAGCVIVDFCFPSSKLDGLCIQAAKKPPFIFLNKDFPKSRRRLSLAHELGHLIMHKNPHENVEEEAWDFAAEFLMPAEEIGKQLSNVNLDRLGRLKSEWGVSMQAILQRAKKLEKISESYSRHLWIQIAKCGYRINEPFEDVIPDETPTDLEKRLKGSEQI
jgi:Zn-dependent peptidase ImmA (M78 family)/transcriptional regulator with XRE-family HTH domain